MFSPKTSLNKPAERIWPKIAAGADSSHEHCLQVLDVGSDGMLNGRGESLKPRLSFVPLLPSASKGGKRTSQEAMTGCFAGRAPVKKP